MKTKISALAMVSAFCLLRSAFGQGSLTPPPGAPAPTMKSLDQIEARTPISTPYTITQPGSYYLTTNLNLTEGDAINIETDGVTLDLNGFTISSTSTTFGTAILLFGNGTNGMGNTDITISNGHITGGVTYDSGTETYSSGPGFVNGIVYNSYQGLPYNVRVSGVSVSGCANDGINLVTGNSTVVESCTVNTVGGYGIVASSVSHSTAYQCGDAAISADTATDDYGYSTGGDGLDVNNTANNCSGYSDTDDGINVIDGNANNCFGQSNSSDDNVIGLYSANGAVNSFGISGNGTGIDAYSASNCYGYSGTGTGINAFAASNCFGQSGTGYGLNTESANNCQGLTTDSGAGLMATTAIGCYGSSGGGTGLNAVIAIGCYGFSSYSIGISANIANSCVVGHGTTSINNSYNMP